MLSAIGPAGLAGLLGAIIGAFASFALQALVLWRTRRGQVVDARFKVAGEFLAHAQRICTEYRMLDVNFQSFSLENFGDQERKRRADQAFERGLEAWLGYRSAHAQLMINPPSGPIREAGEELHSAIDRWVNAVDADYFGVSVVEYEGEYGSKYGYKNDAGPKKARDEKVLDALADYEKAARRKAPK